MGALNAILVFRKRVQCVTSLFIWKCLGTKPLLIKYFLFAEHIDHSQGDIFFLLNGTLLGSVSVLLQFGLSYYQ